MYVAGGSGTIGTCEPVLKFLFFFLVKIGFNLVFRLEF